MDGGDKLHCLAVMARQSANDFMHDKPQHEDGQPNTEKNRRAKQEILAQWEREYLEGRRRARADSAPPLAYHSPDSTIKGEVIHLPTAKRKRG